MSEIKIFDIEKWVNNFVTEIKRTFGSRLDFVGLQGSYGRDEATVSSDVDIVVILDELTVQDLKIYDAIISKMPHREKNCGFVSGKSELMNWEKSDLFQFYYDTTPILGTIDYILPGIDKEDIKRAILIGACNIYHMCGHNVLHEKDTDILKSLYKSATFVVQAMYYDETDTYIKKKTELLPLLAIEEQEIINAYFYLKKSTVVENPDFDRLSEQLFIWSGCLIKKR